MIYMCGLKIVNNIIFMTYNLRISITVKDEYFYRYNFCYAFFNVNLWSLLITLNHTHATML